jgi:hypothetical protein
MRITFDPNADEATIFLSEEAQSFERGSTSLVTVHDRAKPTPDPDAFTVQLAFEEYERLLWIKVSRASKALRADLLAQAESR